MCCKIKSEAKKMNAVKSLANNIYLFAILVLFAISASSAAFGNDISIQSHISHATISPSIVKGGSNYVFTAVVNNDGPDSVSEFRVYNNTAEQNPGSISPFTNLVCYPVTGWNGPFYISGTPTDWCQYTAKNTGQYIQAGQNKSFTFSFDTPTQDSTRTLNLETRDPNQFYTPLPVNVSVDATPPLTTKTFDGPQYTNASGVEWIDGVTKVVLNATDSVGPHDSGLNKTEYRDTLVDYGFCYNPATCGNAQGTGVWQTYTNSFGLNQSCHLLEYKSTDGVGNVETVKKNCFFVDKTSPVAGADPKEPKVKCSDADPSGCSYWVRDHVTEINISCSNTPSEPHPSPLDTLKWRLTVDNNAPGEWNYVDAKTGATIIFEEDSIHKIESSCNDTVAKDSGIQTKIFRVDSVGPQITKTMFGNYLSADGSQCPPRQGTDDKCYVSDNGASGVNITVTDPDPTGKGCNVGGINCTYQIFWNRTGTYELMESGNFTDKKNIIFKNDSMHKLVIECEDALGNPTSDTETFLVDSTPPVTEKTYGTPSYPEGINEGAPYPHWITTQTPVSLDATDNKVGVAAKYWRNQLIDNSFCASESACNRYTPHSSSDSGWNEYNGSFFKNEESCHVIEYYSVDKLGNKEPVKWQCVYVDDTPPKGKKTVGKPSIFKGGTNCDDIIYDGPAPPASGANITPNELYAVLSPGQSIEEFKTVTTAENPIGQLDVLFAFDLTGSMGDELSTMKSSAISMMNNISALVNDSAFAVGSFRDYPKSYNTCGYNAQYGFGSDYPWMLNKNTTINKSAISSAITALSIGDGRDGPEAYARALYETQFAGWREGSRRIVVIFEDNVPHDCGLGSYGAGCASTTGVDPGRDGIAGTADDLNWVGVIQSLKNAGISVVVINSGGGAACDGVWKYAANETGGMYSSISDATKIPVQIVASIKNITSKITTLTLETKPGFESWISVEPSEYNDVIGGSSVGFNVTVTVPPGTFGGEYHLYVKAVGDGSILAVQNIWINVTGEPCKPSDGNGTIEWIVTQDTPVTLTCIDQTPHPVGKEEVCYKISYDSPPFLTENYCTMFGGSMADGWCCASADGAEEYRFNFLEDSMHDLEFYCEDALGNENIKDVEYFAVDTVPPVINKTIIGPWHGDCAPGDLHISTDGAKECFIDGVTEIHVDVFDPEPHPAGGVTCNWSYTVRENASAGKSYTNVTLPFNIKFPEESTHDLIITCSDALGNTVSDQETFIVDHTPPVTTKKITGPQWPLNVEQAEYPRWINSDTNISFTVEDAGPHKSGIRATYYSYAIVNDTYCRNETLCEQYDGDVGIFTAFNQSSPQLYFNIPEESCHLIEYYSVDNVNKTEITKRQCLFVDDTPPTPLKTVGSPNEKWDGTTNGMDSIYYPGLKDRCWNGNSDNIDCWKIPLFTPITLNCTDTGQHPVDRSKIAFNVNFDGSDTTPNYCSDMDGYMNGNGYCVIEKEVPITFYFRETSEHNLKYYCEDALGNKGPIDEEKFKVEGTVFNITINKKWNLISVPFVLLNDSMHKVFDPEADKIKAVWTFDSAANKWYIYTPDGIDNDEMSSMLPGWGYWVIANNDTVLSISGELFSPAKTPPEKALVKGWNLIGYYGTDGLTAYVNPLLPPHGKIATCALHSLVNTAMGYPKWSSLVSYWEPNNPDQWIYLSELNSMDPGAGYWIEMDEADGYTFSTTC